MNTKERIEELKEIIEKNQNIENREVALIEIKEKIDLEKPDLELFKILMSILEDKNQFETIRATCASFLLVDFHRSILILDDHYDGFFKKIISIIKEILQKEKLHTAIIQTKISTGIRSFSSIFLDDKNVDYNLIIYLEEIDSCLNELINYKKFSDDQEFNFERLWLIQDYIGKYNTWIKKDFTLPIQPLWSRVREFVVSKNNSKDKNVQKKALDILEINGIEGDGEEIIIDYLEKDCDPFIRNRMAKVLGTIGSTNSIKILREIMKTGTKQEIGTATSSLDTIALKYGYKNRFDFMEANIPKPFSLEDFIKQFGLLFTMASGGIGLAITIASLNLGLATIISLSILLAFLTAFFLALITQIMIKISNYQNYKHNREPLFQRLKKKFQK